MRKFITKILFGTALVLLLALMLFGLGWMCARSTASQEAVKEAVVSESKTIQDHMDARFDSIESKLDALIKIATTPPPEVKLAK
jgi:hypothetical protein